MRREHVCKEPRYCTCSIVGVEPDESCYIHGVSEWPPRCEICGRYMRRKQAEGCEQHATTQGLPLETAPVA
jgi:hypothetical protein